eukprot:gnl/TRDRNA2_/TRDRNA2_131612_c0_seq1.p1 gnl/TRDRNA2_/TRDRNA2_131612_c0~~gnl/TRDRNA2_/TRDRNA2_131612_c0_seq1.p1  ORF type:complete len:171 (-),score=28.11 gnl/TRDRNA2_/TRDRNA2_131612_c0_seq1:491-1003(-)
MYSHLQLCEYHESKEDYAALESCDFLKKDQTADGLTPSTTSTEDSLTPLSTNSTDFESDLSDDEASEEEILGDLVARKETSWAAEWAQRRLRLADFERDSPKSQANEEDLISNEETSQTAELARTQEISKEFEDLIANEETPWSAEFDQRLPGCIDSNVSIFSLQFAVYQ